MALFRGIQESIALDADNITLVFDSSNIVKISGNIFLYPPQGHPILCSVSARCWRCEQDSSEYIFRENWYIIMKFISHDYLRGRNHDKMTHYQILLHYYLIDYSNLNFDLWQESAQVKLPRKWWFQRAFIKAGNYFFLPGIYVRFWSFSIDNEVSCLKLYGVKGVPCLFGMQRGPI